MPDGQHRMAPETWHSPAGTRLVWTRFQYADDASNGVEVRIVVALPHDEAQALHAARVVAEHLLRGLQTAATTTAVRRPRRLPH